jgi:hypothetical protein
LRQVIADDPIPPGQRRPEISADLDGIVLKCLQKDPSQRYGSARALADDLDRLLAGESIIDRPASHWTRVKRAAARHRTRMIVAVSLFLVGIVFSGTSWLKIRLDASGRVARQRQEDSRRRDLAAWRTWYVADIRFAAKLLSDRETDRAMELLSRHRPGPGADDPREFAWYMLFRRYQKLRLIPREKPAGSAFVSIYPDARTVGLGFSGDSRFVVTADVHGLVSTWDVETGATRNLDRHSAAGSSTLERGPTPNAARAFKSLAHRAVVASQSEPPTALAVSPDRQTLAVGGGDGLVKLWDMTAGLESLTLDTNGGRIRLLAFSADGETLAASGESASGSSLVVLWRAARRDSTSITSAGDAQSSQPSP